MAMAWAAGSGPLRALSPVHPAASVERGREEEVLRPELSVEWCRGFPEGQPETPGPTLLPTAVLTPGFSPSQFCVP